MFLLGMLGFFQVLLFPGLIIRKIIQLPKNIFLSLACIVGLSLITNYVVVFFLTLTGAFVQWLVLSLIVLEIGYILYLYRKVLIHLSFEDMILKIWNEFIEQIQFIFPKLNSEDKNKSYQVARALIVLLFFIIGIIAIEWISRFFRNNIGEVFNTWDAVVSWNRWAVDWASNHMPVRTEDYPQLIPANWALIYKIIGTSSIQFFSKAIMPLFSFLIIMLFLGLGFFTKNPAYFLAMEIVRLIIKKFAGEFISAGYVDLTLTFLVFLAFIMLYLAHKENDLHLKLSNGFLSLIFVSGAVVTKQPGFFALLSVFLIALLYVFRSELITIFKNYRKQLFLLLIIMGLIIIPWYLYKGFQILSGIEESHLLKPLEHTNSVHNNNAFFSNLIPGLQSLGKYLYVVLFLIPALFFIEKFWKVVSIFVVIPYIIIWASYASYDSRNLSMMFPLIALLVSLGVVEILNKILNLSNLINFKKVPLYLVLIFALVPLIILSFIWTDGKLQERQTEKQKQIFSLETNDNLYAYFSEHPIEGKILTNYPVNYLPGFENTQESFWYNNLPDFQSSISNPEIMYLLYPKNISGEIRTYIDTLENDGVIEILFESEDWIPYDFAYVNHPIN